jgi:hypothetical protein
MGMASKASTFAGSKSRLRPTQVAYRNFPHQLHFFLRPNRFHLGAISRPFNHFSTQQHFLFSLDTIGQSHGGKYRGIFELGRFYATSFTNPQRIHCLSFLNTLYHHFHKHSIMNNLRKREAAKICLLDLIGQGETEGARDVYRQSTSWKDFVGGRQPSLQHTLL